MAEWFKSLTFEDIALTLAFFAGILASITTIRKFYNAAQEKRREQGRIAIQQIVEAALKKEMEPVKTELAETKKQLAESNKKLQAVSEILDQNNLQTCRLDLNDAIDSMPHEHKAILDLGWHYFVELGGDVWMSGKFRKWADDEKVDISYIVERAPHLKG